jgi:hypothetical protein
LRLELGHVLHDVDRHVLAEGALPARYRVQGLQQFIGGPALEQVSGGTGLHHGGDVRHVAESGQREHLDLRV